MVLRVKVVQGHQNTNGIIEIIWQIHKKALPLRHAESPHVHILKAFRA